MELTPEQLFHLRKERGLTREELAKELDCSAGAIVQWEGNKRTIPSWVADKMYAKFPLNFTVQELAEMFELCAKLKCTMPQLIERSVRHAIRPPEIHGLNDAKAENSEPLPPRQPGAAYPKPKRKPAAGGSSPALRQVADEHAKDDGHEGLH